MESDSSSTIQVMFATQLPLPQSLWHYVNALTIINALTTKMTNSLALTLKLSKIITNETYFAITFKFNFLDSISKQIRISFNNLTTCVLVNFITVGRASTGCNVGGHINSF